MIKYLILGLLALGFTSRCAISFKISVDELPKKTEITESNRHLSEIWLCEVYKRFYEQRSQELKLGNVVITAVNTTLSGLGALAAGGGSFANDEIVKYVSFAGAVFALGVAIINEIIRAFNNTVDPGYLSAKAKELANLIKKNPKNFHEQCVIIISDSQLPKPLQAEKDTVMSTLNKHFGLEIPLQKGKP